jgi:CHASE2 domain-containing sensor protein
MRIRHLGSLRLMSRQAWLIVVTIFALLTGLTIYATALLDSIERRSIDQRFSLRGASMPFPDIVIIGLDQRSIQSIQ